MKSIYFYFFLLLFSKSILAQNLKPTIGLANVPSSGDAICTIPVYTGNFSSSGYQAGDTIPHFKLYDTNGSVTDVLTVLQTGKPLLLIGGSYTCPVFRQKIAKINQVKNVYGNQINIYVIYIVEAHPKSPDTSPYSGTVWTTSENQTEGVLYLQAATYGARVQTLNDMTSNVNYTLNVPVLLDGPCNEWWSNFGPAPNNAYLIKPNGVIYKKHDWFDKNPNNIVNDIDALLQISGINELSSGRFSAYPNPATSGVTFDLSSISGTATIRILNAEGMEVSRFENISTTSYNLATENFRKGIYFYQISDGTRNQTGKLIIN